MPNQPEFEESQQTTTIPDWIATLIGMLFLEREALRLQLEDIRRKSANG